MSASYTEWFFQLFDTRTRKPLADSTGVYNVLTASSPVELTIYSDKNGTSASNPGTMVNGQMRFYTANTVTSCDISVLTANGHALFLKSATPSQGRIDVNPERMQQKLVIPYAIVGASETVVDTGFDILSNMMIVDIELDVVTAGTGAALTVGTSTATTGFANGVAASTTGFPTTIMEEALVSSSGLFGSLLAVATGTNVRKKHIRANATSGANIVYSNTTSSSTAGAGYIYLTYHRIPTR